MNDLGKSEAVEVHKVTNGKKHVLEFETEKGMFRVATDDLNELGEVKWFLRFIGVELETQEVQQATNAEVMRAIEEIRFRPPVQSPVSSAPDYLSIPSSQMTEKIWSVMSPQQRDEWVRKHNS